MVSFCAAGTYKLCSCEALPGFLALGNKKSELLGAPDLQTRESQATVQLKKPARSAASAEKIPVSCFSEVHWKQLCWFTAC